VRLTVMGEAAYQREANAEELDGMKRTVREALDAGAIGFSSSPRGGPAVHAGTPSTFATEEEMVGLANVAAEYAGCFQFNGFQNLLKPATGFPALVEKVHCNLIGNEFRIRPGEKDDAGRSIAFMEEAKKRGKDINGVVIPYQHIRRFGIQDCFIFEGLPSWDAVKEPPAELARKLSDKNTRARLERERIEGAGKPEFPEWLGWDRIKFEKVQKASLKSIEGRSAEEIARASGKAPVDAFFDTWVEDDLQSRLIFYGWANAHMDKLAEMIKSPQGLIGTDAGAHLDRFFWHGSPAKILGHWCREKKLFGLEEAVRKITALPAEKLKLNRGYLKTGLPADITVFDPDKIDDLLTDRLPDKVDANEVKRHPPGIEAVVVNGRVVVESGACLDVFPGKVTRQELCVPAL
jgi:N-acyl-D-aspartate/D-glutamate deacylase